MSDALGRHTDYGQVPLEEADVLDNPVAQFRLWLAQADESGVYEPNAMVLSTIDEEGHPSSRTVLLRTASEQDFEFFTNYSSQKGRALLANPDVSIVFPWYTIHRQVIIRGTAVPTSAAVSDAYFASRPRGSQVASTASRQSQPIANRELLEQQVEEVERRFDGEAVPRPEFWGGFRIIPTVFEFWQGRSSRLHDRLRFTLQDDGAWSRERLQP